MTEKQQEWATIGIIVAPFGIRGEVKVRPLTDIPDRFVMLRSVYFNSDYQLHTIEGVRPYKGDMLLLKLRGVDDANAAELLRDVHLCVPVSELPSLPPDTYYQHDILGLQVYTLANVLVGKIVDIIPTGGNDVYVIQDSQRHQFLIPAVKDVVKQIDLIRQIMYIHPMRGLLDDDAVIVENTREEEED